MCCVQAVIGQARPLSMSILHLALWIFLIAFGMAKSVRTENREVT